MKFFLSVTVSFCLLLFASVHISLFLSVSVCFCPFLSVSACFCLSLSVSVCFCLFLSVSVRFRPFLSVRGFYGIGANIRYRNQNQVITYLNPPHLSRCTSPPACHSTWCLASPSPTYQSSRRTSTPGSSRRTPGPPDLEAVGGPPDLHTWKQQEDLQTSTPGKQLFSRHMPPLLPLQYFTACVCYHSIVILYSGDVPSSLQLNLSSLISDWTQSDR